MSILGKVSKQFVDQGTQAGLKRSKAVFDLSKIDLPEKTIGDGIKTSVKDLTKESVEAAAKRSIPQQAFDLIYNNPRFAIGILAGVTGGSIVVKDMIENNKTLPQALAGASADVVNAFVDELGSVASNVAEEGGNSIGKLLLGLLAQLAVPISIGVAILIVLFIIRAYINRK